MEGWNDPQAKYNLACIFLLMFTTFVDTSAFAITQQPYMESLGDIDSKLFKFAAPLHYLSAGLVMFYIASQVTYLGKSVFLIFPERLTNKPEGCFFLKRL